jgi:hypothetical protein
LLARAAAVEAALEARADHVGRVQFGECLDSDADDPGLVARCIAARARALETVEVMMSLQAPQWEGSLHAVKWAARVSAAVDREAERWVAWGEAGARRRSVSGRAAAQVHRVADRAKWAWRWVIAPTGLVVGEAERVTSLRLIRGRVVAVLTVLLAITLAWLSRADNVGALSAAGVLIGALFVGGVNAVAMARDRLWWRAGTLSVVLAAIIAMVIVEPPGSRPAVHSGPLSRVEYAVLLWAVAAPIAVLVVGRLRLRRRRRSDMGAGEGIPVSGVAREHSGARTAPSLVRE